jgi:hypothetical protein
MIFKTVRTYRPRPSRKHHGGGIKDVCVEFKDMSMGDDSSEMIDAAIGAVEF